MVFDQDGEARSWGEFRKLAVPLTGQYYEHWLEAEFDAATRGAQAAAEWERVWNEREIFPLLRYNTMLDNSVRPTHQVLEGVTLPVEDPFWKTYYPPNGWRCRCYVSQLESGELRHPLGPVNPADVPPLFRNNPGVSGEIFTREHPYFATVSQEVAKAILQSAAPQKKPAVRAVEAERAKAALDAIYADTSLSVDEKITRMKEIMRKSPIEHGIVITDKGALELYHGDESRVDVHVGKDFIHYHNHPSGIHYSGQDILIMLINKAKSSTIITGFFEATVENFGMTLEEWMLLYDNADDTKTKIFTEVRDYTKLRLPKNVLKRLKINKKLKKDEQVIQIETMRSWVQLFNRYIRNAKASITLYGD